MIRRRYQRLFKIISLFIVLLYVLCCFVSCGTDFLSYPTDTFAVHYIDVGQGDCSLISCDGEYMLIDSGQEDQSDNVLAYLHSQNIDELEYVVATHPHSDHIGGMHYILAEINVNTVIMPEVSNDIPEYHKMIETIRKENISMLAADVGNVYSLGSSIFTVLAPNNVKYDDMNNYSIVIKFDYKDTSFLFTGDCEQISEYEMLAAGYDLGSDVLKVAHHGSSSGTCEDFIKAVMPTIAVISAGKDNQYGHPHNSVIALLAEYDVKLFCTMDYGTIIIISDGTGYSVVRDDACT